MDYSFNKQADHFQLSLTGSFTFNDNNKFREIVGLMQDGTPQSLTLDLSQLEFIDSAALGMLLLLNDEAQKLGTNLCLTSAEGQIKKMLQLSNFDQIFTINYTANDA
ncbi:MAG: STAS domain-containing protein [Rickettsiales bacterium]